MIGPLLVGLSRTVEIEDGFLKTQGKAALSRAVVARVHLLKGGKHIAAESHVSDQKVAVVRIRSFRLLGSFRLRTWGPSIRIALLCCDRPSPLQTEAAVARVYWA